MPRRDQIRHRHRRPVLGMTDFECFKSNCGPLLAKQLLQQLLLALHRRCARWSRPQIAKLNQVTHRAIRLVVRGNRAGRWTLIFRRAPIKQTDPDCDHQTDTKTEKQGKNPKPAPRASSSLQITGAAIGRRISKLFAPNRDIFIFGARFGIP